MLRSVLLAVVSAACLFTFGWLGDATGAGAADTMPGGLLARAGLAVFLGTAATAVAYGEANWMTVAVGALSALVFGCLTRYSMAGAALAMCALWLLPRVVLAEGRATVAAVCGASFAAAVLAAWVFAAYWEAPLTAHATSCVFAGFCLALVTIVVPVQTAVAGALATAARAIDSPARQALERAALAHRDVRFSPPAGRPARSRWRTLVALADERAALEHAAGTAVEQTRKEMDERIRACAAELAPLPSDGDSPQSGG